MPYEKLLEVIVVGSFAGENRYRRCKSAAKSAKLFHLKNVTPTDAGGWADLLEGSIPRKAFSDELAASPIISLLTAAHRRPFMLSVAWTAA